MTHDAVKSPEGYGARSSYWLGWLLIASTVVLLPTRAETQLVNDTIELPFFVWFESGATATKDGEISIDLAAMCLRNFPNARVRLYGYTDRVGAAPYNKNLAGRRAQRVRESLIERSIDPTKIDGITVVGEDLALAEGSNEPVGRRVEILIEGPASSLVRECPPHEALCKPTARERDRGPCLTE